MGMAIPSSSDTITGFDWHVSGSGAKHKSMVLLPCQNYGALALMDLVLIGTVNIDVKIALYNRVYLTMEKGGGTFISEIVSSKGLIPRRNG